jgi:hypothetical protein
LSSDLNGIDEYILKQEKSIRESQNQINIAKKYELKSEKELFFNEGKFFNYNTS